MPKTYDYDLFVIGAGSGGVRASRIAAGHGAKVAVAEEFRIGGTCVIRGCVPKKLLVYGSHFAEELQDAAHYGWTVGKMTFDWATLRDTVLRDVDRLEAAYTQTLDSNQVEHFHERATITGPHGVKLASGRAITARYILVATGAWPVMPEITLHHLERSVPPVRPAQASGDQRRRLHRPGIRGDFQRARLPRHRGQPQRRDPARV
jgi:glutathione reductase (NADPH)